MFFLYNLLIHTAEVFLRIAALMNPKLALFVNGRKDVFNVLRQKVGQNDKVIWFHAASLGEYEQGLPIMEKIKESLPGHKVVLTFFSPSGYEVRKNNTVADVTVYLPMDTATNARKFLSIVNPQMVFFIKYEYWPNYLREIKRRQVEFYLVSGIFRKDQVFFKWYGGFYRKALDSFMHFFVQNSGSKDLLASLGKTNVTVSGDTRFDRVAAILEKDNTLDFIQNFKAGSVLIVAGSSWPKDEEMLSEFIKKAPADVKMIIAPHNIKPEQIANLQKKLTVPTVLFSEREGRNLAEHKVFIIDTIGILTKIYSYADIAYVGGGFGNPGVHNILEPATFGIPIVIGPNYSHFAEATALVNMKGCTSIKDEKELASELSLLIEDEEERSEKGHICSTFVQMNRNATQIILKHLGLWQDKSNH